MTADPVSEPEGLAEPFQVMPELTDTEFEALKDSIRSNGCLVAIEYDEQGNVLDGHHRLRALRELGITSHPRVIRAGLTESEKTAHALALNVHRRHLNPAQRAEAISRLRQAGWSIRRIAAETGIHRSTVARDLSKTPEPGPDVIVGEDGKTYPARTPRKPTTVYVHSDYQQRTAEAALAAVGEDAPTKTVDLRRLERMHRERRAQEARTALAGQPGVPSAADIRRAAIADLDIEPGSVDLILTDPPYSGTECWAPDGPWDTLGQQALRWLKPGGLLLAYTGHIHLARTLTTLSAYEPGGLQYWWTYAVTFPGGGTGKQVRTCAIAVSWRPVVAYRKSGGPALPRFSADPVAGSGKEKDTAHPWQQSVGEFRTFIERLTAFDALVVDPFIGSGSVAIAAVTADPPRRVIVADIDPAYVALAQRRVAEALADTDPSQETLQNAD